MKSEFDVADKGITAHSCAYLIALSKGVHSHKANLIVYLFFREMHSYDYLVEYVNGIMKSVYNHAKQALPGGGNMK